MNCKTCKYWEKKKKNEFFPEMDERFGECKCSSFMYNDEHYKLNSLPANSFLYMDYEGWEASFVTGEEFGCIHYKILEDISNE